MFSTVAETTGGGTSRNGRGRQTMWLNFAVYRAIHGVHSTFIGIRCGFDRSVLGNQEGLFESETGLL
jgi:hypothetical protein